MAEATERRDIDGRPQLTGRRAEDYAEELELYLERSDERERGLPAGFNNIEPTPVQIGGTGSPGTMQSGWMAADATLAVPAGAPTVPLSFFSEAAEGDAQAVLRQDVAFDGHTLLLQHRTFRMDKC